MVADGLRYDTVVAAGDALWPGDPGLSAADLKSLAWLDESAAARQEIGRASCRERVYVLV